MLDPADLECRLASIAPGSDSRSPGKLLVIPVLYAGADLEDVAARLNLTHNDVIQAHTSVEYDVFAIGFLPGYPYAGYLPPVLSGLPRREVPRLRRPGRFGRDRGPPDRDLSSRIAGWLARAGNDAALHRQDRSQLFPHCGRRSNPIRADLRRRIRSPPS